MKEESDLDKIMTALRLALADLEDEGLGSRAYAYMEREGIKLPEEEDNDPDV